MQLKRSELTSRYRRQQERSWFFSPILVHVSSVIVYINFTSVLYRVSICKSRYRPMLCNFGLFVRLSLCYIRALCQKGVLPPPRLAVVFTLSMHLSVCVWAFVCQHLKTMLTNFDNFFEGCRMYSNKWLDFGDEPDEDAAQLSYYYKKYCAFIVDILKREHMLSVLYMQIHQFFLTCYNTGHICFMLIRRHVSQEYAFIYFV